MIDDITFMKNKVTNLIRDFHDVTTDQQVIRISRDTELARLFGIFFFFNYG